jgi:hypothetical protein
MSHKLRIEKLISLATDAGASENEARSAAYQACLAIKKYGFRVVEANHVEESRRAPDPHPPQEPRTRSQPQPTEERRVIYTRYSSRCIVCGGRYYEGDPVLWARGKGASHIHCGDGYSWGN